MATETVQWSINNLTTELVNWLSFPWNKSVFERCTWHIQNFLTDPDKPWFVESINVTITDGPSAEELVAKKEQENLNSTDHARNTTSSDNSTNAEPRQPKWLCSGRKMPENTSNTVLITDDVVALNWINGTVANATGRCTLVLFYARFCTFCANMAPLYNALGRAVSDIPIIALDAYTHTRYVNWIWCLTCTFQPPPPHPHVVIQSSN